MCKKLKSVPFSFVPISIEHKDEYSELFALSSERASDYSFINIWGWSEERRYELAFNDGLCWLRLTSGAKPVYWAPVGNWDRADWLDIMENFFPAGTIFERVPQTLADMWAKYLCEHVQLEEQRSEWEYLYDYKTLVSLSGNKMHKKKNLVNQFLKLYNYSYAPIDFNYINIVKGMQKQWYEVRDGKESPALMAENIAITRVLDHWEKLPGIMGGLLFVDGKTVAYTVAEDLGNGTIVVHFEKGLDTYKGIYQAINQMFLANTNTSSEFKTEFNIVNREQDMGSPGIRQAKESYNPIGFIKKYQVRWLG